MGQQKLDTNQSQSVIPLKIAGPAQKGDFRSQTKHCNGPMTSVHFVYILLLNVLAYFTLLLHDKLMIMTSCAVLYFIGWRWQLFWNELSNKQLKHYTVMCCKIVEIVHDIFYFLNTELFCFYFNNITILQIINKQFKVKIVFHFIKKVFLTLINFKNIFILPVWNY